MVDVLYTYSINGSLGDDFILRLIHLVEVIPNSVFYDKRILIHDTDSAFNERIEAILKHDTDTAFNDRIEAILKNELADTLQIAATVTLADLYSYKVEGLMTLFKTIDSEWYCCLFVPYRESELKIFDDRMPRRYIVEEISARIGHYLRSANIDNCFIIGYRDPREPRELKGVRHV